MKRGKNYEKVLLGVGPMFPRLHVNDTTEKKGGPRAPPRNKMALYEQFSVPSQRFNSNSNDLSLGPERTYSFPVRLPSQTLEHLAESYIPGTPLSRLEQGKEVDKDDGRAYNHSRIDHSNDKTLKSFDGKKLSPMGSRNFSCSVEEQNDGDKGQTQLSSLLVAMKKDARCKQQHVMSVNNRSTGEVIDGPVRQAREITDQEDQLCIIQLQQGNACLQQECITGSQSNGIQHDSDSTMDSDRNTHVIRGCFHSSVNQSRPLEVEAGNGTEYLDTRSGSPIEKGSSDESDDLSKISSVENLSSLELSPDGVAKILGQNLFWKARRKITNQMRVFAVQVFELHRLLKVQQLIAESPDVLLEDAVFLGKLPLKGSTPKSLSLEIVVEPQPHVKQKDRSEKINREKECSAENAVGKTAFPSPKNDSNLSNYTFLYGNPHQANVANDDKMGSWCFNPSPAHQWLIPVMSPSEGLVYKPYLGPFGQGHLDGTFMNPAYGYGVPPSLHQAISVSPFIPPGSYACFPPHGAPAMNHYSSLGSAIEQVNQIAAQGSHGQNGHSSGEGGSFKNHNQNSCNLSNQKNEATQFPATKKRELQASMASSPGEIVQQIRPKKFAKERHGHSSPALTSPIVSEDVLQSLETRHQHTQVIKVVPLNPRSATESEDVLQSLEIRQHPRVIKVVPRNPRSATESAARIFQSIQKERKQYDLV